MPTTTSSAASRVPSASSTSAGPTAETSAPQRRSTPAARYQAPITSPITAGSAPGSGAGPASTTVTSQPSARATVAVSAPIQPAPTRTILAPGRSTARRASASSTVRSRWARSAPGSAVGVAPVATTRLP